MHLLLLLARERGGGHYKALAKGPDRIPGLFLQRLLREVSRHLVNSGSS